MLDIVQQREAERSLKLIKDINPVAYDVLYDALEFYKKNNVADVVADIDEIVGKALKGDIT